MSTSNIGNEIKTESVFINDQLSIKDVNKAINNSGTVSEEYSEDLSLFYPFVCLQSENQNIKCQDEITKQVNELFNPIQNDATICKDSQFSLTTNMQSMVCLPTKKDLNRLNRMHLALFNDNILNKNDKAMTTEMEVQKLQLLCNTHTAESAASLASCEDKPFHCLQCEFKCNRKSSLQRHTLIHTGEKPFHCPQCEFKCNRKSHLQRHFLIHTGEKPFQCPECEFKFNRKSHLQRHTLIHTGEKPFQCPQCEFKCNRKSHLQRHFLTHTGEKPFQCPQCHFKFSRKSHLQRHFLIHTRESLYQYQMMQI